MLIKPLLYVSPCGCYTCGPTSVQDLKSYERVGKKAPSQARVLGLNPILPLAVWQLTQLFLPRFPYIQNKGIWEPRWLEDLGC